MGFERTFGCLAGLLLLSFSAAAFEPGAPQICEPSADGQSFVCREKGDAAPAQAAPRTAPSAPPSAAAIPLSSPSASTADSSPPTQTRSKPSSARALPNYLLQNPSFSNASAPSAAEPSATPPQAEDNRDAAASVEPAAAPEPPPAAAPAAKPEPAAQPARKAEATPAPAPEVEAAPVAATEAPAPSAPAPAPTIARESSTALAGAEAFKRLPASHFTVVLASTRNSAQLDELIRSLQNLSGELYLLRLTMPDGDWYSLCWSDYPDLDSARAARFSLPADASITSGWPRRIGLLQNELAR